MIDQIIQQLAAEGKGPFEFKTIPQGAATSVWAATVGPADEIGGRYCEIRTSARSFRMTP